MAQLSDDCFAFGGRLMTTDEALALLDQRVVAVTGRETVGLGTALNRILADDLVATRDVPPHDNSAVDGYAIYFDDLAAEAETRLALAPGRAAAGHPLGAVQARGTAVRIFTGAPMPAGAAGDGPDTVMMQEDCTEEASDGMRIVRIPPGIKRGSNRRKRGEDVRAGGVILKRGQRLRPQDIGLAASIGRTALDVHQPLKVAVFSTGDEIREPGTELPPGCVYDANRFTLAALLTQLGCTVTDLGVLPDRVDAIRDALARAAQDHGLIITSGGVSTGAEDHVKAAVEALGSIHAWRLAIKPGRPIALGQVGRVPFLGLPGNPVAVMVTFLRIARPMILKLMGGAETAPHLFRVRAAFEHKKKKDRREWVRARLAIDADGTTIAEKFPRQGAGILTSMVESDGLVELPEAMTRLVPGTMVDFLPFSEVS
ncbi:MAG: gephyrin-like molybdotransferase Glp [Candidatus Eiseniibacteriota bacterium]